jgi:hypothetical protein
MTEPKRRGRPPKAKLLQPTEPNAVEGCAECGQAEGHYDDCGTGLGASAGVASIKEEMRAGIEIAMAQAYALRVWHGQSADVTRAEKIRRVKLALDGQNLPFEGVELP